MTSRWSGAVAALAVLVALVGCGTAATQEPLDSEPPPLVAASGPATVAPATQDPASVAPATPEPAPTDAVNSQVQIVTLFKNSNDGGVHNGVKGPASIVLTRPATITYVQTYHWNDGKGVEPGTISIVAADGSALGKWQATGTDGQGGVKNAYWQVEPNLHVAAGTYLVDNSSPETRSTNDEMGGIGQTIVSGFFEE